MTRLDLTAFPSLTGGSVDSPNLDEPSEHVEKVAQDTDLHSSGVDTFYGIDEINADTVKGHGHEPDPVTVARHDVQDSVDTREQENVHVDISNFPGTGTGLNMSTVVPGNGPVRILRENAKRRTVVIRNPPSTLTSGPGVGILYIGYTAGTATVQMGFPLLVGEVLILDSASAIWCMSDQAAGAPVRAMTLVDGTGD